MPGARSLPFNGLVPPDRAQFAALLGRANHLIANRVHRSHVVDKAPGQVDGQFFAFLIESGGIRQLTDLRAEEDPDEEPGFDALRAGGIQRLYTGNMLMGKHKLVVTFRQRHKDGRIRRRNVPPWIRSTTVNPKSDA